MLYNESNKDIKLTHPVAKYKMFSCLKACLSLGLHEILICHILASILTRYNLFDLLVSPTQTNKKQLLSTHNKYLKNKGLFIT